MENVHVTNKFEQRRQANVWTLFTECETSAVTYG